MQKQTDWDWPGVEAIDRTRTQTQDQPCRAPGAKQTTAAFACPASIPRSRLSFEELSTPSLHVPCPQPEQELSLRLDYVNQILFAGNRNLY